MFRTPYERLKLRFRVIRETLGLLKTIEADLGNSLEIALYAEGRANVFTVARLD